MKILFWGAGLFIFACLIHFMIWKLSFPKGQTKALSKIFTLVLVSGISVLAVSAGKGLSSADYLHISILYAVLALAYINTYSAIEVDSPTLVIVSSINNAGKSGLSKIELEKDLCDEVLISPRIKDLLAAKLISFDGNRYRLTKIGLKFVCVFIFWRKLLNVGWGG